MSKTNDTSKFRIEDVEALDLGGDATCTGRELRDDELQKVSGGASGMHVAEVTIELLVRSPFAVSLGRENSIEC